MIWDSWTVTNVYALKCPKCPMIRLKFVIKKSKATPKKIWCSKLYQNAWLLETCPAGSFCFKECDVNGTR